MSREKPEVGDVWVRNKEPGSLLTFAGQEFTITEVDQQYCKECKSRGGHPRFRRPDGKTDGWCLVGFLPRMIYVRGPEPAKVEPVKCAHGRPHYCGLCGGPVTHEGQGADKFPEHQKPAKVDWAAYLPPHPLEDTGPKEFKVGQVWGYECGGRAVVYRVESVNPKGEAMMAPLVERNGDGRGKQSWIPGTASCARLIQDAGESQPRPVEQVYGVAKAAKVEPAKDVWRVGQRRRGPIADLRETGDGKVLREYIVVQAHGPNGFGYQWTVRQLCNTEGREGCTWGASETWPSELLEDVTEGAAALGTKADEPTSAAPREVAGPPPPSSRPVPLGMSEADVAMEVKAAWEGKANGIRGEAPKGVSAGELEALANPWKRRRS